MKTDITKRTMRRFESVHTDPKTVWSLPETSAPSVEGRTMFPSTVVASADAPRLLVDGYNSRKIGRRVTKGPWSGMPIFTLTLEERKTCPRSCGHWLDCYGNAMPFSRRHAADDNLMAALATELGAMAVKFRRGFVIRLHVLGDFFSEEYAAFWRRNLAIYGNLHIFGYTAHDITAPIGKIIRKMNLRTDGRCAIRFSGKLGYMGTVVVDQAPSWDRAGNNQVCPAQTGKADCCGACALCWAPAMRDTTIVFIKHGPTRHRKQYRRRKSAA